MNIKEKQMIATRYKWSAVAILCCVLYIAYAHEFFIFSSATMSYFTSGFMKYYNTGYSMMNGKLTLLEFKDFLITATQEEILRGEGNTEFITVYNEVIMIFFGIGILELLLLLINSKFAKFVSGVFMTFIVILIGFAFMWKHKFTGWESDFGANVLKLSAWPYICFVLSIIMVNLCGKRQKILHEIEDIEQDISEKQSSVICPYCNKVNNGIDNFCCNCGRELWIKNE